MRRGGGSDLGILGLDPAMKDTIQYVLFGAPLHFGPKAIDAFLPAKIEELGPITGFGAPLHGQKQSGRTYLDVH